MTIKERLRDIFARRMSPAQRRALADELAALADQQRDLAEAEQRQLAKPPAQRLTAGRGGRPSLPWVDILREERRDREADRVFVRLSTKLYQELGSPARIDVQRVGGLVALIAIPDAQSTAGYKVMVNVGGVRINASGARDILPDAGKYVVTVVGQRATLEGPQ